MAVVPLTSNCPWVLGLSSHGAFQKRDFSILALSDLLKNSKWKGRRRIDVLNYNPSKFGTRTELFLRDSYKIIDLE
jgi:hypothetical protein